jgi:nicotinamide riboside kinase
MSLIVNSFAGPGTGKSTFSGGMFKKLKTAGFNVEYVQEFAKTLTWEKNFEALRHQYYVTGVQMYTQNMLENQVEAIITDSPIIIGLMYNGEKNKKIKNLFNEFVYESFKRQDNINFFLNRVKKYNPKGRTQTLEESIEIDKKIKKYLKNKGIKFIEIDGNDDGLDVAYDLVKERLK